jgi:hypothetical protein
VTAGTDPTVRAARAPTRRTRHAATASKPKPSRPDPASPTTAGTPRTNRRNAEPESRRRHWHPAVLGVRAAVPAARWLVGGGRC